MVKEPAAEALLRLTGTSLIWFAIMFAAVSFWPTVSTLFTGQLAGTFLVPYLLFTSTCGFTGLLAMAVRKGLRELRLSREKPWVLSPRPKNGPITYGPGRMR
jgi:hypothetical protein